METFLIPVAACRFTLQELSAEHLWPSPDTVCEVGLIVVSRLDSGDYFVHNGRHRVIRARLAGVESIEATPLTSGVTT